MEFKELDIKGVWLIRPERYGDSRGYFSETWKQQEFENHVARCNLSRIMSRFLLAVCCEGYTCSVASAAKPSW